MKASSHINKFLISSRQLFNGFFLLENPCDNADEAWDLRDLFNPVQAALFYALVLAPLDISGPSYGMAPQSIRVRSNTGGRLPAMINRELESGYWDFPIKECGDDVDLRFIRFFDWSEIERRDNRYVMVKIVSSSKNREIIDKLALIESHYCSYETV